MNKYILLSFVFLGWGFWELSGGGDFSPQYHDARTAKYGPAPEQSEPSEPTPAATAQRASPTPETTSSGTASAQTRTNTNTPIQTATITLESDAPQSAENLVEQTEPTPAVPSFTASSAPFVVTNTPPTDPSLQTPLVFKSPSITITGLSLSEADSSFDSTTMTFAQPSAEGTTNAPATTVVTPPAPKLLQVRGSRVNLRSGPGTSHDVIEVLLQGSTTEVVQDDGGGWLKLRVQDSGRIGWMSRRMLEPAS